MFSKCILWKIEVRYKRGWLVSLAKQMTYFSHKGGKNPWILAVKGRVNTKTSANIQGRKIQPGMGHWREVVPAWGHGHCGHSKFSSPDPCNRQKTGGKQNGLISVAQEGTLPCTPFNGELPKNSVCSLKRGNRTATFFKKRKKIFAKKTRMNQGTTWENRLKGKIK